MKINQTYDLARRWERLTGTDFRRFVDILPNGDVLPNVQALEDWLQPDDGESVEGVLLAQYGADTVWIMTLLFL